MTIATETEPQIETKPQLARIIPLKSTGRQYQHQGLMPIENTPNGFGILLVDNFYDEQGLRMEGVNYLGKHRKGKLLNHGEYNSARIEMQNRLYVVKADVGKILPVASQQHFTLCELTEEEYDKMMDNVGSLSFATFREEKAAYRKIMADAIKILSERVPDFSAKRKGILGRLELVTPPGYADQEKAWYDMPERLRVGLSDR